jgi:hypothetical protein
MIFEIIPEEKRVEALMVKKTDGMSILKIVALDPELKKIVFELLPQDIALTIQNSINTLGSEFEKHTLSLIKFMSRMKGVAPPQAINGFVDALVNNQGVKEKLDKLFNNQPSLSFFSSDKETIKECLTNLDIFWLKKIPENDHFTPNTKRNGVRRRNSND